MQVLIQAFVLSKLDYCNSLLSGTPSYNLQKLQPIQNMAARIIFNCSKHDSVTPILKEPHGLKIEDRIVFQIAVIMYNRMTEITPKYLRNIIINYHNRWLRSSTNNLLPINRLNTSLVRNGSFRSMGPHIWNSLPLEITQSCIAASKDSYSCSEEHTTCNKVNHLRLKPLVWPRLKQLISAHLIIL